MGDTRRYAQNLLKALEFAAEKHRDQRRKGVEASPYINHPIQVAEVLATFGKVDDLTTLLAAVLRHGAGEDPRRLRPAGRAPQPPCPARLARRTIHQKRVGPKSTAQAYRHQRHVSTGFPRFR